MQSIISGNDQSELAGVCFQVFVFPCHLQNYSGGRLSVETEVGELEDTVPSVTTYHLDCSQQGRARTANSVHSNISPFPAGEQWQRVVSVEGL